MCRMYRMLLYIYDVFIHLEPIYLNLLTPNETQMQNMVKIYSSSIFVAGSVVSPRCDSTDLHSPKTVLILDGTNVVVGA